MSVVVDFVFNPFQENTYLIFDETKECIIIDPGCYSKEEKQHLDDFIDKNGLTPVRLVNTHCHIDHVFGNYHIAEKYNLELEIHKGEVQVLESLSMVAQMYGIPLYDPELKATKFLSEQDVLSFGNTDLKIFFTPGHSPASISFYNEKDNYIIGGDVLFQGSIGRTDLPGGDFNTLINSIKNNFMNLPVDTKVYSGHGSATTIGFEAMHNPFLQEEG